MSELVGFFALSQSKLVTFHKLMFQNFYLEKTANQDSSGGIGLPEKPVPSI